MNQHTMARCGLFAALMCLCAWISVPIGSGAFTLQTFALFLSLGVLGGRQGSVVCLVYLLLGTIGLPVFSGFRGGLGVLLGPTGGYLLGFLAAALAHWGISHLWGAKLPAAFWVLDLAVCYAFGTAWYLWLYAPGSGLSAVLATCVLPYLLPDAVKLFLAWGLCRRLEGSVT